MKSPGGAAIFAPDSVRETFRERSELIEGEDGARALRCVQWTWDPDRRDTTCVVDFAFLLREAGDVKAAHDHHVVGLFPRATWERLLASVGYRVGRIKRPVGEGAR